jgi:uncharacterized membrane protein YccC
MGTLRVPVTQHDHSKVPANAPVALIEYGDFESPGCGAAHPIVNLVLQHFGPKLQFVSRHFALANVVRAAGPPLLFGLRLWASVCLALYVAFWLQLDNPYWAGTSAAIVCLPHLGASLRKGWFRMIGTVVGAVAIVVLTAVFPQNRFGFLVGLALWGGACALVATLLRNFAAYAAALAGFTAAIVASDQLGATGGQNGQAFMLAVYRVSEIWIGIVSAGIVLAGTDFGDAPRRLAAQFAALAADIAKGFSSSLALAGLSSFDTLQPVRREFIRRVIALDTIMDESLGESSRLRYQSPLLQGAIDGLFYALAAWRTVAVRLASLPVAAAQHEAGVVLRTIPEEVRSPSQGEPTLWTANPIVMRRLYSASIRTLNAMPASTPSLRLLADQTARVLAGLSHVLDGLALLAADPAGRHAGRRRIGLHVPDWAPALVNGGRAFVAIGAIEVFWIATEWPNGALAITFTAVSVILLAPTADAAYAQAMRFTIGTVLAAICAAIILFAVLPQLETFAGFSMAMALYLVPVGMLMAQASPTMFALFYTMSGNFVPLLAPANQMSYDTVQFYNSTLAIVAGCGVAALSFRLLPPLSPAFRVKRHLELTLRDLRRLATANVGRLPADWEGHIYKRLVAMPDEAEPLQRAQLLTALLLGREIIVLRRIAPQRGLASDLDAALEPFAQGNSAAAFAELERLDRRLTSPTESDPQTMLILRERARILLICDALMEHRAYFDGGESI